MESVDKVHGIHGQSPAGVLELEQLTISSESMENIHGFFPVCSWIFSSMPMDCFHGIHEFVQGDSGHNSWTLSYEQ